MCRKGVQTMRLQKLKAMVSTHVTVCRDGKDVEVPLKMLVPGDIIRLGSVIWCRGRCKDTYGQRSFLNQSALTGESLPVEKNADPRINHHRSGCSAFYIGTHKTNIPRI
jgi:magnesium-transporting ATPase (P-type)